MMKATIDIYWKQCPATSVFAGSYKYYRALFAEFEAAKSVGENVEGGTQNQFTQCFLKNKILERELFFPWRSTHDDRGAEHLLGNVSKLGNCET